MSGAILTCLCGAVKTPFRPHNNAQFPIPWKICHCNVCRQSTGALFGVFPKLIGAPPPETLASCTRYDSLGTSGMKRYFCTRCGTHVCFHDQSDGNWHGCVGAIETAELDRPRDRIRVTGNIFVGDTLDGGILAARPALLRMRYGQQNAKAIPAYSGWPDDNSMTLESLQTMAQDTTMNDTHDEDGALVARCHCGGVDLRIQRANYARNDQGIDARHIPLDKTKYKAFVCPCRSCRLASGTTTLQPWAAMPQENISIASTVRKVVFGHSAMEGTANEGTTLKQYWSSEKVCWSFCGTCGATIFYWNETKPNVIDVAVGILRAREGSLARMWLSWNWEDVSFSDEAVDEEIYQAIVSRVSTV